MGRMRHDVRALRPHSTARAEIPDCPIARLLESQRSTNILTSTLPARPSCLKSLLPEKFNTCGANLEASMFVRLTSVSQF